MLNKNQKQDLLDYFEELCKAEKYYRTNAMVSDVNIINSKLTAFYDIAKIVGLKHYEYAEVGYKYLRD